MLEEPSWLSPENDNVVTIIDDSGGAINESEPTSPTNPLEMTGPTSATPSTVVPVTTTRQDSNPELVRRAIAAKHTFNIIAVSACGIHSFFLLVTIPKSISIGVLCVYSIVLSTIVFCSELAEIRFLRTCISRNFGFLYNPFWRFNFYVLLASIQLSYDTAFGVINAIAMGIVAIYNTYVLIRYPSIRQRPQEQEQRQEQRNDRKHMKEAQTQVHQQLYG
mmetsp:Transcript_13939/g.16868  ORF Transcript_13939/g.16868 Transcript_13939/m.16868 type:complete len:220 (+) Transcript_13939:104-763(+)|eukprot:CAMPEP_0195292224 /NCGR_PEP_ID=MMETSP0707-20130614/8685_1 /TAXON_ID=33640 /ORGANISM="Asterionellopsis glacialis, Strain CCMP134" /LENGTH=219 /DNA_ID=CAMNT_0040352629 /DNA_START=45 /DNA_END=704 /DNA_ORIENTATION=+